MKKSDKYAELLWKRFILQDAVYVEQWKGSHHSGYKKIVDNEGNDVPLKYEDVIDHVFEKKTLGIYQLKDNMVKTICWDVDSQDLDAATAQCEKLLDFLYDNFGIEYFIVEYSGSKGFHVWMFFDPVTEARNAYRFGRWVVNMIEQVPDVSIEVFPKQTSSSNYGNLIKLPWGINLKTGSKCLFVDASFKPFDNQYNALNNVVPWKGDKIEKWMDKKEIPTVSSDLEGWDTTKRFLCMKNVMQNGAVMGHRNIAIHKLACHLHSSGLPFEYGLATVREMNSRSHPPADDQEIIDKVDLVYEKGYSASLCRERGLDVYCSPDCVFFAKKAEIRGVSVEQLSKIVGGS